jgi:polyhydroxyalkanoate synthase subunit PhaC
VATHLDDADFLAQIEAVDRFTANMIAYPGRTFGQLYHRFVKGNALVTGSIDFGDRTISLAAIEAPVLVFGGATDGIAPTPAVKAVMPLLTGAREARFEIVPGGHLGMLTGRAARNSTWRVMDEWISQWSSDVAGSGVVAAASAPVKRSAARKPSAKKSAAKKSAARKAPAGTSATKSVAKKTPAAKKAPPATKSAAKKTPATKSTPAGTSATQAPAKKTAPTKAAARKSAPRKAASRESIGANPARRYGSGGSRALSPTR